MFRKIIELYKRLDRAVIERTEGMTFEQPDPFRGGPWHGQVSGNGLPLDEISGLDTVGGTVGTKGTGL